MRILIALVLVKSIVGISEEPEILQLNQTAHHDETWNRNSSSSWSLSMVGRESHRIFQGTPATGSFPFMVALVQFFGNNPIIFCGASLIDNQRILTAAHCINAAREIMSQNRNVQAWIGVTDLDNFSGPKLQLQSFMRHPLYLSFLFNWNDVGIITLASAVRFNAQVSPICIGTRKYNDEPVSVVGFGISDCRRPSRKLLIASGRAFSQCRRAGYPSLTLNGQLCVQSVAGSADRGDSGGPLFTRSGNQFSLVGLVSHGHINETTLCPLTQIPTVYSQANSYRLFIRIYAPGATFC